MRAFFSSLPDDERPAALNSFPKGITKKAELRGVEVQALWFDAVESLFNNSVALQSFPDFRITPERKNTRLAAHPKSIGVHQLKGFPNLSRPANCAVHKTAHGRPLRDGKSIGANDWPGCSKCSDRQVRDASTFLV